MPVYKFEIQIETLARNAVNLAGQTPAFEAEGVHFSQWDFNHRDGWLGDAWLARIDVSADSYADAYRIAFTKLNKTVPRLAFVTQCYVEYLNQSSLVSRSDQQIGFLRYTKPRSPVGLMFVEQSQEALDLLLGDATIPDEFFYYWNDATNTVGYPGKLLLMFSALEALVKVEKGKKDFDQLEKILGTELKEKLFGTKRSSGQALRNRLVHGDYFGAPDSGTNYVDEVHKKVLSYFNAEVLKKQLLELNVVSPQRHFYGNREEWRAFIAPKQGQSLELRPVLKDLNTNSINNMQLYEAVYDEERRKRFQSG